MLNTKEEKKTVIDVSHLDKPNFNEATAKFEKLPKIDHIVKIKTKIGFGIKKD